MASGWSWSRFPPITLSGGIRDRFHLQDNDRYAEEHVSSLRALSLRGPRTSELLGAADPAHVSEQAIDELARDLVAQLGGPVVSER